MTVQQVSPDDPARRAPGGALGGPAVAAVAYGAIAGLGALLAWLSATRLAELPIWLPFDFSAPVFLATALTLFWYLRGLARGGAEARPPAWRMLCFGAGLALVYAVLQTRFEYWSQHMFFLNRVQHISMHHVGPVLIALGFSGPVLARGAPGWVLRLAASRPVKACLDVLQHPLVAPVLFLGLFILWLVPEVHFRAMLDPRLYALMNWSMVLDGVLFWSLILDPRPQPPARASYGLRIGLAVGIMFPQIVLGALITFAGFDLYPYYDLCGRLFPSISALDDQQIGGIVIWIPPAMMSILAMILVLNAWRLNDRKRETRNAA